MFGGGDGWVGVWGHALGIVYNVLLNYTFWGGVPRDAPSAGNNTTPVGLSMAIEAM